MAIGDDDKLRGRWDEAKGRAKKAVGEIADDPELKREGTTDKIKGRIEDATGRVKNAIDELKK